MSHEASEYSTSDVETDALVTVEDAVNHKNEGNTLLRDGALQSALAKYREGLKVLHKLSLSDNTEDYKTTFCSLHLNISLLCIKLEDYFEGIRSANEVLKESNHPADWTAKPSHPSIVKALYRRGLCHSKLGDFDDAIEDFQRVLTLDASNADARKELQNARTGKTRAAQAEKNRLAGLFSKTQGLYSDREEEKRLREEQEKKLLEEQKKQWAEEGSTKPFEVWKEEREKAKEEEARRRREELQKEKIARVAKTSSKETLELDEEDRKIVEETAKKGYCYFRKELTEEEKALKAANVPKPIAAGEPTVSAPEKKGLSDWNASGTTYEEKDTSKWCIETLRNELRKVSWESPGSELTMENLAADPSKFGGMMQQLSKVKNQTGISEDEWHEMAKHLVPCKISVAEDPVVKGSGQTFLVRGKLRRLYELSVDLKLEMQYKSLMGDGWAVQRLGVKTREEISPGGEVALEFSREPSTDENEFYHLAVKLSERETKRLIEEAVQRFELEYQTKAA